MGVVDFSQFVGIPWSDRGRTLDGCDCWGLLRLVLASIDIHVPSYYDRYDTTQNRQALSDLIGSERPWQWHEIPSGSERRFDAILIRLGGQPHHIGVVERCGYMLHMLSERSSVIEPYTMAQYSRRVIGFYRHEALV